MLASTCFFFSFLLGRKAFHPPMKDDGEGGMTAFSTQKWMSWRNALVTFRIHTRAHRRHSLLHRSSCGS